MKVKLSQAFDLQMGKTPSRNNAAYWNGDKKWVSIADIGNSGKYISDTKECITEKGVRESGIKAVPKKTVIMSFKLSIGKTAITAEELYTNEAIMAFIDKGIYEIDSTYFYHLCCGKNWTAGTNKAVMGLTLNKATISEIEINLPDIFEQREIAAKLDRLDTVIADRQLQLEYLDQLVKSRFVELFGDPILNPYGWAVVTVGDIVTDVRYGTSKPAVEGGKYPYLRMNNLTYDGHLDLSDMKYIDIPDNEIEKCIVRKGDVLFNRTNSIELVGKTCVFDLADDMVIAGYIIRVRLNEKLLPIVLSSYMNLPSLKEQLRSMAKGAVNQANINAQELQSIKIYLPPIELQNQFATFVEQIDKSKAAVQKALDEAQLLFDSLMQQYFG